jgi:hypothetical protein
MPRDPAQTYFCLKKVYLNYAQIRVIIGRFDMQDIQEDKKV